MLAKKISHFSKLLILLITGSFRPSAPFLNRSKNKHIDPFGRKNGGWVLCFVLGYCFNFDMLLTPA